jgi:hypothetical protein
MAYNPNIPQAADLLSQTQAGILGNFTEINNLIDPNTGEVKKAFVIDTAADPATTATQVGLYQKIGATSGIPELFFRRNTSGFVIPMTEAIKTATGWSYLPSGLIIQWGTSTINNSTQIIFNKPFTNPGGCLQVFLTSKRTNNQTNVVLVENFAFNRFVASSRTVGSNVNYEASNVTWFAIGY